MEARQGNEKFKETKERGDRRLRLAKENRRDVWQTAHSPFSRSCRSCGARPATLSYTVPPVPEALCDWCYAKRIRSDDIYTDDEQHKRLRLDEIGWGKDFLDHLLPEDKTRWEGAELAETTDELAELSRPANYLGFLYADGNGMGRRFADCEDDEEYRQLSQRVSHSLRAALWLALNHHFRDRSSNGRAPFEIVALGGDDLILLCAADRTLPVAITLSRLFTRISAQLKAADISMEAAVRAGRRALAQLGGGTETEKDEALTLSCAAVLSHPKQPILNLEKEALQLLSQAKRAWPDSAAIDFHVVSSPVLRSIRDIRRYEYRLDKDIYLTARPLRLDEAEKLLCHVRRIKYGGGEDALPRNKLNALYQALFSGKEAAAFEAFFLYYRLGREQRRRLDSFFKDFDIDSPPPLNGEGMPWGNRKIDDEEKTYTILADLAELFEFVPRGSAGEPEQEPKASGEDTP